MSTPVKPTGTEPAPQLVEQIQSHLRDLAGAKLTAVARTTGPDQLVPAWRLCFDHGRAIIAEGDLNLSNLDGQHHGAPTADQVCTALQWQAVTHAWIGDDESLTFMFDQHWSLATPPLSDASGCGPWTFKDLGDDRWRLKRASSVDTEPPSPPGGEAPGARTGADARPSPIPHGGPDAESAGTAAVVRAADVAALLQRYLDAEVTAGDLRAWAENVDARLGTLLTVENGHQPQVARALNRLKATADPLDEREAAALIAGLTAPARRRTTWRATASVVLACAVILVWGLVAR